MGGWDTTVTNQNSEEITMALTKLDKSILENLPDYNAKLAEDMAREGLCLSPYGEWVEIAPLQPKQSYSSVLCGSLARMALKFCRYPLACISTVALFFGVAVLASCGAWFSLPLFLGCLIYIALTPKTQT